ncbi:MAG: protein kinase [Terriglobia bacterium]
MPSKRPPWWLYPLAVSYFGYLAFLPYTVFTGPDLPPGIEFEFPGEGLHVKAVLEDSFWKRAGLVAGDRVVAIDGVKIRNIHDWQAVRANTQAEKPQQWEMVRDHKSLVIKLSLPKGVWYARRVGPPVVAFGLISFSLALLITIRRPSDPAALWGAWLLATTPFAFGVWDGWAVMWRQLPSLVGALLWIPQLSRLILDGIALTFFLVFPSRLFKSRWPWALVWIPVLIPLPWRILGIYTVTYQPQNPDVPPEWVFTLSSVRGVVYVAGAVMALALNYWRLEDRNERRRLCFMAAGMVVSLVSAIALIFLESRGLVRSSIWAGALEGPLQLLSMSFPLSSAYAILKHRMFDIRVMIRQGLQYALARGFLIWLIPGLGFILLADLLLQGDQPLIRILRARGWAYAAMGGAALVIYYRRRHWMEALDRRFFRDHYDAQRLLGEIVQEVREAGSLKLAAPRLVAQVESALHPEFAALMVREPQGDAYCTLAAAPAGQAPPPLPLASKLATLVRVLEKPLEIPHSESGWLQQQLAHEETDFLRRTRIDLLVPIATDPDRGGALLALGAKRSEEPYTREDQDVLMAIAASMALLLDRPMPATAPLGLTFQECPECGSCHDTATQFCPQEGAKLRLVRLPRQLVGRYRLEQRRGRGGMGAVYEATDLALERRVAVKVVREDLVGSAEAAERFRREARAVASFSHPNVVTIYDFGLANDSRAFLVMELLEGSTLRELLCRENALLPHRALEVLRGVCAAVASAHRRMLIHRDLKPENIFLARQESGEVAKVLDFGIAKFLPSESSDTSYTGGAVVLGTLPYTCPEQLRGEPVQPFWDLWALAVIAYEMLTGARPFAGSGPAEWHGAILSGRVIPVTCFAAAAPESWEGFFRHALAFDPAERPDSADSFVAELEQALS